jgi:hypothetical protein
MYDILTWMDSEHPQMDMVYMDSYSDFQTFGVDNALDIMEHEVCYLASFGKLGHGRAQSLHQYTHQEKPHALARVSKGLIIDNCKNWDNL